MQTYRHILKAVLLVRKQLPDGRLGSKVSILLYFFEPKPPSGTVGSNISLMTEQLWTYSSIHIHPFFLPKSLFSMQLNQVLVLQLQCLV